MLASYDRNPEFGPEECLVSLPVDNCPDDKRRRLDYPLALKRHLLEHGYMVDSNAYPVPGPTQTQSGTSEPSRFGGTPSLTVCVEKVDTVRKLILQTFLARDARPSDPIDAVSMRDDTTLEGNDTSISKLTCAVTYDINLKRIIGRLAEDGNLRRSGTLMGWLAGRGQILSQRVRYTVKPTAKPGVTYVEILP